MVDLSGVHYYLLVLPWYYTLLHPGYTRQSCISTCTRIRHVTVSRISRGAHLLRVTLLTAVSTRVGTLDRGLLVVGLFSNPRPVHSKDEP